MGTGTHDQIAGFLLGQTGDFRQLVRRQFGQIVTRMHLTLGQLGSQLGRHAFEFQQVLRGLKTLFLGDRLGQQRIAARARNSLMVSSSNASISSSSCMGT